MDDEVEKLAESLKASGLASSIEDGREKAKEMLKGKNKGQPLAVGEQSSRTEDKEESEDSDLNKFFNSGKK